MSRDSADGSSRVPRTRQHRKASDSARTEGPARSQGRGDGTARLHARYWRRARRFSWLIAGLWLTVTFLATWFARDLDVVLFGWPLSFYLAAQGAPIFYLVLVIWYGRHMERLDRRYGVEERDLS